MLSWQLFEFFGIAPRFRRKQLPKNYSIVAHDVDLTHGTLRPFHEPLKISDKTGASKVYAVGCDIFTWDECVSVAEWLPDCPRLFVTGRVDYPETATIDNGKLTYRRLGVLRPPTPPSVTATDVNSETSRNVAYVATFVNNFGEESGPSLPSSEVIIEDGQPVNVSVQYYPPLEYDIEKVRVYRRETGYRTGSEKIQEGLTGWFLVAELDVGDTDFVDDMRMLELNYGLSTLETREPPADLKNITAIDQSALLVGSSRNKLVFSKHMQPHNFPISDEMTLDDNIVALGSLGNSLFVATDGHPYRLIADAGCSDRDCREIVRYDEPMPMIACHTGKGSVVTPYGFIYVSADGLVLLPENGNARVITTDVLSADDWRLLEPHTMRLEYHKGAVFIISDRVSFMYWLDNNTYSDSKNKRLITISDRPIDMVETRQGELLFMTEDGIYQWNAGIRYRPYRWVSEFIDTGYYFDITRVRALVDRTAVRITTESDRGTVERFFPPGDTLIPYKRHGRRKEFQLRVEGTGEVLELAIGVHQIDMSTRNN